MNPGRELDALIAMEVMGFNPEDFTYTKEELEKMQVVGSVVTIKPKLKPYSTDITAAWEVVEKIKDAVKGCDGVFKIQWNDDNKWVVYWDHEDLINCADIQGESLMAPHAICLAALKAVGHEIEK
jgi:hypothetical protein